MTTSLDTFEARIGYRFSDRTLLEAALTHRSYLNEAPGAAETDNERLEFFGDAVLSLFVSLRLFADFPGKREGQLSRIRSTIVDENALARSAVELDLGDLLRLGRGECASGGRTRKSLLADAYEALLGALYLDGGAAAVTPLIDRHYSLLMADGGLTKADSDSKSAFQEAAQAAAGATPTYRMLCESGPDHAKVFHVAAYLGDEMMGEGTGTSRKRAEQEAARHGLERLAGQTAQKTA